MDWKALGIAVLLTFGPAAARADEAARLALAGELMDQLHYTDLMRQMLPAIGIQMRQMLAQKLQLDEEARTFTDRFQRRASSEMGRFTDMIAHAYAEQFTEADLEGLLAFDRTPLGQKLIAATPALTRAAGAAGQRLGQDVAAEVIAEMEAEKRAAAQPGKL